MVIVLVVWTKKILSDRPGKDTMKTVNEAVSIMKPFFFGSPEMAMSYHPSSLSPTDRVNVEADAGPL